MEVKKLFYCVLYNQYLGVLISLYYQLGFLSLFKGNRSVLYIFLFKWFLLYIVFDR